MLPAVVRHELQLIKVKIERMPYKALVANAFLEEVDVSQFLEFLNYRCHVESLLRWWIYTDGCLAQSIAGTSGSSTSGEGLRSRMRSTLVARPGLLFHIRLT